MTPTVARSGTTRSRFALRKFRSLERKLPVLMTAVLAVVLASSLFLTYGTLALSAESAARDRLQRAVREVGASIAAGARERALQLRAAALSAEVRRALLAPSDSAAARAALAHLVRPDSLRLELWNAAAERIASTAQGDTSWPAPFTPASAASTALGRARAAGEVRRGSSAAEQPTGVSFTTMYARRGAVFFWGVVPVFHAGRVIGYVAQERRLTGPARATQSLRELTGEDVSMFLRNLDGSLWASAPGDPATPPTDRDSGAAGITQRRTGVGRVIVTEAGVAGTPWIAALETPLRSVRARARATAVTLAIVSVILVAIGAALTLGISRSVTRPLVALTRAAEGIAEGSYDHAVSARARNDEIGRLAESFAQMADEIAASHRELERRVSDTQSSADALERANQQLQEAIRDAEIARQDAERASRAKSDFLAVMSHELRTPLNAIAGYAQLIELEVFGAVNDAQRDALARIARSQAHLLGLINSVLNFAKIDAGQVDYAITDVPLGEVLAGVEPLVAPQMRAKTLAFDYQRCDPDVLVRADADKLQQIVLNLLTNAIKFTPPGGRIGIECEVEEHVVHVHVRDTGVGIPPDRLHEVFEPFVQGERALNRPNEGVGLGLAIARDLARGMAGSLSVDSQLGSGSVFTVSVPRSARGASTRGSPTPSRAHKTSGTRR